MLTPYATAIYSVSIVLLGLGLFALVRGEFPLPDRFVGQRRPERARLGGLVLIAAFPLVLLVQSLGDLIGSRAGEKEHVQARMALQTQRETLSNQAFHTDLRQGGLVIFDPNPEQDAQRARVEQQIAQLDREHEAQKARSKEFAARGLELMIPVVCLLVAVGIVVTGASSPSCTPPASDELAPLELQLELSRIELEWERERPKHMVASRFGKLAVPRKHDAAISIALMTVLGIGFGIWVAAQMPANDGIAAGILAAGVFLLIGVGVGAWSHDKAEAYEQAEAEYLRKREAARAKYGGGDA
jgi:hypothetical protein